MLVVEDDGPGIPEHVLARLFEPFFTTKPTGKGTGLGLSISYDIVKRMGGDITAENRSEGGARFRIVFPPVSVEPSGDAAAPRGRSDNRWRRALGGSRPLPIERAGRRLGRNPMLQRLVSFSSMRRLRALSMADSGWYSP